MPIGGFEVGRFLEIACPKEQALMLDGGQYAILVEDDGGDD